MFGDISPTYFSSADREIQVLLSDRKGVVHSSGDRKMHSAFSAVLTLFVVSVSGAGLESKAQQILHSFQKRLLINLGISQVPDMRHVNTTEAQLHRMTKKYLRSIRRNQQDLLIFHHTDCDSNSHVVFHPDLDYDSPLQWARLKFPNASLLDSSEAVFSWRRNSRKRFLRLPCVQCCGARLELKVRNPAVTRPKRSSCERKCCRRSLKISFKEIGWNWILQPKEVEIFYCRGRCNGTNDVFSSNHAIFRSILNIKGRNVTRPCCTPYKLKSLELLHYDNNDPPQLVVSKHKAMIVDECACT
ncbi:hypothetical protein TNCT_278611 [Trichonephila clavata]|uniref:TGF-beta family profile domain-containing protein n=1 Tax=Trichonephila clavata TaxID=2740835 RepID=A0A8X6GW27_TRICU|nr:hypothetical protein TNCT_278611 [Trichonephila clavata]